MKQGFTLIELMVVIVIIGILAAIAIPKLFGMSAKAKAQEVGPAAGTWSKLQLAYKMETGDWGSAKQISYKLPGDYAGTEVGGAQATSKTGNFDYIVGAVAEGATTAKWEAKSRFPSDPCANESQWFAEFKSKGTDTPEMSIKGKGSPDDTEGCVSLTPNFYRIGCVANGAPGSTANDPECPNASSGGDES
jgi:prepilin-type N-terminal cleavage/methylation domain-containing protein